MNISSTAILPTDIPKTKKAGFYAYDQTPKGPYAFFWTNAAGKPFLISKLYQTAKGRKRVLDKVQSGQYEIVGKTNEAEEFLIIILNKSKHTIATSIPFGDVAARDKVLASMHQSIVGGAEKDSKTPKTTPPRLSVVPNQPTRHSFRLVFYRSSEDKDWQGVLSYPLTDEKVSFMDIDTKTISTFLRDHLAQKNIELPLENRIQTEGVSISWPKVQSIVSGTPLTLALQTKQLGKYPYEASIVAKALAGGTQTLISRRQFRGDQGTQNFNLAALTGGLAPGMYRLTAQLECLQLENKRTIAKESQLLFLT